MTFLFNTYFYNAAALTPNGPNADVKMVLFQITAVIICAAQHHHHHHHQRGRYLTCLTWGDLCVNELVSHQCEQLDDVTIMWNGTLWLRLELKWVESKTLEHVGSKHQIKASHILFSRPNNSTKLENKSKAQWNMLECNSKVLLITVHTGAELFDWITRATCSVVRE